MGHGVFEMHCAMQSICGFTCWHVIPYCVQTFDPHVAACMHAASHVGSGPPVLDELDTTDVFALEDTVDPPVPETVVRPVVVLVDVAPVPAVIALPPLPPVPSTLLPQPANPAAAPIATRHPKAKATARMVRSPPAPARGAP
jgi:hypothetical protein